MISPRIKAMLTSGAALMACISFDGLTGGTRGGDAGLGPCCAPAVFASNQSAVGRIAIGGGFVYWTTANAIMRCPVTGCGGAPEVAVSASADFVSVSTTLLAWHDLGAKRIEVATLNALDAGATEIARSMTTSGLALDDTVACFQNGVGGQVLCCPTFTGPDAGCIASESGYYLSYGVPNGLELVVERGMARYWIEDAEGGGARAVVRCAASGCGNRPEVLATRPTSPKALAFDETSFDVVFTEIGPGGGAVAKVSSRSPGDGAVLLGSGFVDPEGVAVDGAHVFVTDRMAGTVSMIAVGGGSAVTLASGQKTPHAIAVDGNGIYWANEADGTIMRIAKCAGCGG